MDTREAGNIKRQKNIHWTGYKLITKTKNEGWQRRQEAKFGAGGNFVSISASWRRPTRKMSSNMSERCEVAPRLFCAPCLVAALASPPRPNRAAELSNPKSHRSVSERSKLICLSRSEHDWNNQRTLRRERRSYSQLLPEQEATASLKTMGI